MDEEFPTLYEMEPIGIDSSLEAVTALHFCSNACRISYKRIDKQAYSEGTEPLSVNGELCEYCNRPLELKGGTQ